MLLWGVVFAGDAVDFPVQFVRQFGLPPWAIFPSEIRLPCVSKCPGERLTLNLQITSLKEIGQEIVMGPIATVVRLSRGETEQAFDAIDRELQQQRSMIEHPMPFASKGIAGAFALVDRQIAGSLNCDVDWPTQLLHGGSNRLADTSHGFSMSHIQHSPSRPLGIG